MVRYNYYVEVVKLPVCISIQVNVNIDYIKPAQDSFPEKVCCTVTREDM